MALCSIQDPQHFTSDGYLSDNVLLTFKNVTEQIEQ